MVAECVASEGIVEVGGFILRTAAEGAGDGGVEFLFEAAVQRAAVEGDEVRALPAGHVDDLQVLAGLQGAFIGQPDLGQDQAVGRRDMVAHVGDATVEAGGRVQPNRRAPDASSRQWN